MSHLLVSLVTLLAVETFLRLPILSRTKILSQTASSALDIVSAKELTDDEKQEQLLRASLGIFTGTLILVLMLLLVGGVALGSTLGLARLLPIEGSVWAIWSTWSALAVSIAVATVYCIIRNRLLKHRPAEDSDYGVLSRLLHRVALGSSSVAQASFDLECALHKPGADIPEEGPHVFITGLARAGTTILMRALYETGAFRSLTYRDMPFVLMPNTWAGISAMSRRHKQEQERAHGDRIKVDYDSPEAFEEVFWRTFCGEEYIGREALKPHKPDQADLKRFRRYIALLLNESRSEGQSTAPRRYLSKNNNNLLRLDAIGKAFPEASIILPFRDPIQHAISLLTQHENFLERHAKDRFSLSYMNWLGHHEFGAMHKPFSFPDPLFDRSSHSPTGIDYWLINWIHSYRYLLDQAPPQARFISYERLCSDPQSTLGSLFDSLDLSPDPQTIASIKASKTKPAPPIDAAIEAKAREIYAALDERV